MQERTLEIFEEMVLTHSPSRQEKAMTEYAVNFLRNLGASIYLHENQDTYGGDSPVIFAKIPGILDGAVTLNAHTDVIQPNENVNIVKEDGIWRTDGTTTLGADDKAGLTAIFSALEHILDEGLPHKDVYIIITPAEEVGMLGAKHIDWDAVDKRIVPAKNMIVFDNGGGAENVAYQAPTAYQFSIEITGRKAHAGMEPEKGINAIQVASRIISEMPLLRIDDETTANISYIHTDQPHNVVADHCVFTGEIRSQSDEGVQAVIAQYQALLEEHAPGAYKFDYEADYPALKSKDDLAFVNEIIDAYSTVGVEAQPQIIGGGSDANYFAEADFNAAIVGVGMMSVHTTDEYLVIDELMKTTKMLIHYLTEG